MIVVFTVEVNVDVHGVYVVVYEVGTLLTDFDVHWVEHRVLVYRPFPRSSIWAAFGAAETTDRSPAAMVATRVV